MPLLFRPTQADPELWRAVHDKPAALPMHADIHPALDLDTGPAALHGMPADRMAMAASRLPARWTPATRLS